MFAAVIVSFLFANGTKPINNNSVQRVCCGGDFVVCKLSSITRMMLMTFSVAAVAQGVFWVWVNRQSRGYRFLFWLRRFYGM